MTRTTRTASGSVMIERGDIDDAIGQRSIEQLTDGVPQQRVVEFGVIANEWSRSDEAQQAINGHQWFFTLMSQAVIDVNDERLRCQ